MFDDTMTTRDGADVLSRGRSNVAARKWPTWFTPKSISRPLAVSCRFFVMTPAFSMRTSSRENLAAKAYRLRIFDETPQYESFSVHLVGKPSLYV
jgi:hypothetical protein